MNKQSIKLQNDIDTPDFVLQKGDEVLPLKIWFTDFIWCLRVKVLSGEFKNEETDIDLNYLIGGSKECQKNFE